MCVCIKLEIGGVGVCWCVCVFGGGSILKGSVCVEKKKREGGNSFVAGEHRRQIEEVLC